MLDRGRQPGLGRVVAVLSEGCALSESQEIRLSSKVPQSAGGASLLDYLTQRFRYQSEAQWQASIEAGRVEIGGLPVDVQSRVRAGEIVTFVQVRREPEPEVPLRVIEDRPGWAVVDKPAGMPCHSDGAFVRSTVTFQLAERLGLERVLLVHRIDRETSGLLVVAKTRSASRALHQQFEAGTVEKVYEALLEGCVEWDRQRVEAPIARHPSSSVSMRRAIVAEPDGKPAVTELEVLRRSADRSWVRARIETGRAHQIRVHCESLGHPVVGDKLYGRSDAEFLDWVRRVKEADGELDVGLPARFHLLHARTLCFDDPESGERLRFESSPDRLERGFATD